MAQDQEPDEILYPFRSDEEHMEIVQFEAREYRNKKRAELVGRILQGMVSREVIYFGMAEDALALADAALALIEQNETLTTAE